MTWPDAFPSKPSNKATFWSKVEVEYRFQAEDEYTRLGPDSFPDNNTRSSDFVLVSESCESFGHGDGGNREVVVTDTIRETWLQRMCHDNPASPWCKGGFRLICGIPGIECPLPPNLPIEVLFDNRFNGLVLAIITSDGKRVADMESLLAPVREGGNT